MNHPRASRTWLPRPHVPSRPTNLALLAGLLTALGLPPYPSTGLLVPAGLALLFGVLRDAERPGRLAWLYGLTLQTALLHWMFFLVPAKSIPTRALVPVQAVATIAYVALFYLAVGWVFGRLRRRLGPAKALLLLPVVWSLMESARAAGELGFPWCLSGAAVLDGPLMGLLRAGGEPGVGAAVALTAAAMAWFQDGWGRPRTWTADGRALLAATAAAWLGLFLLAAWRPLPPGEAAAAAPVTLPVAAIQANVDLGDKWDDAKVDSSRIPYTELTERAAREGARFVVWAETAVPAYLRYDATLLNWTRHLVQRQDIYLYTGFPDAQRTADGAQLRYNSSGLFNPEGALLDRYPKHHLLPIGEAMPFTRWLPFLAGLDVGQAEWAPGPPPQAMTVPTPAGPFRFSGLICFESVFGGLARDSVRRGSRCLIVLTNDGWFGETAGPRQHAALARLRAVECAVPVIRSANNGISYICDQRGCVLDRLDLGRRGLVQADVTAGDARTAYVRWGEAPRVIFLLAWLLVVLILPRPRSETVS